MFHCFVNFFVSVCNTTMRMTLLYVDHKIENKHLSILLPLLSDGFYSPFFLISGVFTDTRFHNRVI